MIKTIRHVSLMTALVGTAFGGTLGINSSSITDGATQVTSKPNMVFVFNNDITSGSFVLKDANNKTVKLRKSQINNTVSVIPRRGLKDSQEYTLTMEVKDGNEVLTKTLSFTVGKGDRTSPLITSSSNVTVAENQNDVMRLSATDENSVIYSLYKSRDASKFNLDPNSGDLSLKEKADYESKRKYVTKVTATDSKGNKTLQSITVRVSDIVNEEESADEIEDEIVEETPDDSVEETPITEDGPVFTTASEITLDETQKSVVKVHASGTKVRYSLGGEDASSFNLNSKSGMLKFKTSPKFSDQDLYIITITATDKDKNSSTQTISITITKNGESREESEVISADKTPIANAGTDKSVIMGNSINIIGSGLDSDGIITKYEWKKGEVILSNMASFTYTPDSLGTDILILTVTDNEGITNSDSMKVIVTSESTTICTPDTTLAGGYFTDSDSTTPTIDVMAKFNKDTIPDDTEKYVQFTQQDYRDKLGELTPIHGNKHNFPFNHYRNDFEKYGWPEVAHLILRYIQANSRNGLFVGYDGVSEEGIHYHFLWLSGLEELAKYLDGYKDPDEWNPPVGVKKIIEPLTHDIIMPPSSRWNNMTTSPLMLTLPDATDSGSHDSTLHYYDPSDISLSEKWPKANNHYAYGIEKVANSYLLGAYGQLGLGDGKLEDQNLQTQSLLHFSGATKWNGHAHKDTLMMGLFGQGRNLLSFPGHQNSSKDPENKNMLMIDLETQNKTYDIAGRVEIFSSLPGIKVSRVDASQIIHEKTSMERYRRTLIQNTIDIEKSYLLDIFEAVGGGTHDFMIRGSGVLKQEFPKSNLSTKNGTSPVPNSDVAKFSNTKKAEYNADESFWIKFNFSDKPKLGSISHFPAQKENGELYLNSMKEAWTDKVRGGYDHYYTSLKNPIPQYTVHRSGTAPLKSTFVAVHEVQDGSGKSFIKQVTKEVLDSKSIAVKVELTNGRVDTYLVSFDGKKSMSYNDLSADAIIAASSSYNDKSDLWMIGGSSTKNTKRALNSDISEEIGIVSAVNRKEDGASSNSFDTNMTLPIEYELANQTILLENFEDGELKYTNSYTIKYIEEICGKTRIHVNFDPGVEVGSNSVKELLNPRREATSARLKFVSSATTVPYIAHVSPGKDPMQRINPQVGYALDVNEDVQVTTLPSESETITYTLNDKSATTSSTGTIDVGDNEDVTMYIENSKGFVNSRIISQKYYKRQTAIIGTEGKNGLLVKRYRSQLYNLGNYATYKYFGNTEVVEGLTFSQVPYELASHGHGIFVEGYIKVPTTGLYKFSTRMDAGVQLKIDDNLLIEDKGMRRTAQWVGEIYLEKGLHKILVDNYVVEEEHFSVMWEGPGIPYSEIPESVLFQNVE